MEVRPGYRQTEMAVIPEEWAVVSVKKLVEEQILEKPLDGNHGNIHPKSSDYVDYGIPFVMANNFVNGQVDLWNCKFISKERADKLQKGFSISGDVLLTHKGTVGNTAIVGDLSTDYIMLTPQVTYYRVINPDRLDNRFLRQYFESQPFQSLFTSLAGGGTRAYLGIVKQLDLPLIQPPIEEQRAIATALSEVDALLGALDRLIAKKRDLKQAAMHQLLTGQTRLPGFTEKWNRAKVSDLCQVENGEISLGGEPDYLEIGDVDVVNKIYDRSRNEKLAVRGAVRVPSGTLLISTVRPTRGAVTITREDMYVSSAFCRLRISNGFLFHLACDSRFLTYLGENSIGGTYPTCREESILSYKCFAPTDPEEQTAIAAVLTDMDTERATLERRRDKTRALKQAMMQELLTGKTRLVPPRA